MIYEVLVQGRLDGDGCYHTYWIEAERLGLAIERACRAGRLNGIESTVPCRASSVDEAAEDAIEIESGAYCSPNTHTFPFDSSDESLQFPVGVIPDFNPEESDPDDIVEAFAVDEETKPFGVELVVDRRRIHEIFFALLDGLPSASALEINICGHWDDTGTAGVFLSPNWDSHEVVASYIQDHKRDLLFNGFVHLAIYSRREKCTLRLTDHKTICFYAEDSESLQTFVVALQDLGFNKVDSLRTIARGFYHHHYRPVDSPDRVDLVKSLESDGFRFVDSLEDE